MNTLLQRRMMIAGGAAPVPTPTGPLPYIRNTKDAYIDTGITADNTVRVIVWARNFNPTGGWLFGSRNAFGSNAFCVSSHGEDKTGLIRIDYAQSQYDCYTGDQFSRLSDYHRYELSNGVFNVDGVNIFTSSSTGNFSNGVAIHLFGMNNNGNHLNMSLPADIFACKIYKNGALVRNYSPVQSPSVGLYDSVSGTVFTNAGSGSLSYNVFDTDSYQRLSYVECNGAQGFVTGVYGSNTVNICAKFRLTGGPAYASILGTRVTNTSGRCDFSFGNTTYANRYFYFGYKTGYQFPYNLSSQTGSDLIWIKAGLASTMYKANARLGNTVNGAAGDYTTTYTMSVGGWYNGTSIQECMTGRLYFVGFGEQRNYVPAKVSGVAGFYDTYNDVFYPSTTGTNFIEGPTI